MIVTDHQDGLVTVTVYGEFSLADYKEFEELVNYKVKFEGVVNLLFDLRQMADFTLDMAWEEI
ncbi:MAG: STAS/SEC14 domain-containing protein, partial [Kouleothrix sp.]